MSFNSADTRMEKHQSESKHYLLGPPNKETMMANALCMATSNQICHENMSQLIKNCAFF